MEFCLAVDTVSAWGGVIVLSAPEERDGVTVAIPASVSDGTVGLGAEGIPVCTRPISDDGGWEATEEQITLGGNVGLEEAGLRETAPPLTPVDIACWLLPSPLRGRRQSTPLDVVISLSLFGLAWSPHLGKERPILASSLLMGLVWTPGLLRKFA